MEELVEILIRLISALFENRKPRAIAPRGQPPRLAPQAPPAVPQFRRQGQAIRRNPQRLRPTNIAVARPIVTATAPAVAAPPPLTPIKARKAIAPPTAHSGTPSASATALRKWLTPATLKQQFLLTEILQPPLALRDQEQM